MEEQIADAAEVESTDTESQSMDNIETTGVRIKEEFAPVTLAAVGAVIIGFLLVLIQWGSPVLVPILMAMYIAALCLPIYTWLLGRGVRKNIALVLMLVVILLGFAAIGLLLIAGVDRVRAGLSEYAPGLNSELPAIQAVLTDLGINESSVDASLNSEAVTSFLSSFLGTISGALGDLLFSLILVAFFLLEVERFFDLADTKLKDRPIFGQAPIIAKTAVTYFGVRTRLNLLTGVLIGIALSCSALTMPYCGDFLPSYSVTYPTSDCLRR